MKRVLFLAMCGALVCRCADQADGGQLDLVKRGQPASTIVIPENATRWTKQAADWLQEYVEKTSGATLPIVTEGQAPTGTLVSVGLTKMAIAAGIDVHGMKWDGCRLTVKGDVVYLLGKDNAGTKTHDYIGARGTCRAVIKFLEEVCGVRWFLPGPQGEVVPLTATIHVPRDLDEVFQPAFAYSEGRSLYDVNILDAPGNTIAALANNYRQAIKISGGGHTWGHAVPVEKYFKDHPEYFALINGKRTDHPYTHLCTSNPDVKRLLVEWMRMRFDQGYDWVAIGQSDGWQRCECDECEKLDNYRGAPDGMRYEEFMYSPEGLRNTPPGRIFLLHKAVIDELAKSHPDKKVMLMCYAPTAWPSNEIAYFGDNVIGEIMHPNPEILEAWSKKVNGQVAYTCWFNTQCPMGVNIHFSPEELAERVRWLHEQGIVGLTAHTEANWGLEGPLFYMMGRLMGDPHQDYEALVKEYCHGVYGKAGNTMVEFFDQIYAQIPQIVPLDPRDIVANGRNVTMPQWMKTTDILLAQYPPEFLDQLEALLSKAEGEADTEKARGWMRLTRDFFDFNKLLTHMLISYRTYQSNQTRDNWLELKQRVEAFDTYRMKILTYPKEYTDVWFPGHMTFCKWMVGNLENEGTAYYGVWEPRKAEAIENGVKGRGMGYGTSYYYSFIDEPLTLDFSKEPQK